jgi:hypothetical protein
MKPIKFITTFSKAGYHVYGKKWIETFAENTKNYSNITASVYINGMDMLEFAYLKKTSRVKIFDFDREIPEHKDWINFFNTNTKHDGWIKSEDIKFSYKAFTMLKNLEKINEGYLIWLDADCIFLSDDFDNFPQNSIQNNFIACQLEKNSEHVESGIVIFDCESTEKKQFGETMKDFYCNAEKINTFDQLYDGYVLRRTINTIKPSLLDLNEGHGVDGIQSDSNFTFLNPEIHKRFLHNIGINGKKNYDDWDKFKNQDEHFSLFSKRYSEDNPIEKNLNTIQEIIKDFVR